jgi:Cu/Ag efflux protein CusF
MFRRKLLIAIVAIAAMKAPALAMEAMLPTGELLASGRVVKVDIGASRITIEHKPIWRFYTEAGTRIFKVRDVTMLLGLTPGDWIRFIVERTDGGFVVTWIENSNGW